MKIQLLYTSKGGLGAMNMFKEVLKVIKGHRIFPITKMKCNHLLFYFQDNLNITYTLIPHDGRYGGKKPDGSWTGVMGQLVDENIDIGMIT